MHTQDALNQLHQQYYTSYLYQPCTFKAEDAPPTVSFKYGLCTTEAHNSDRNSHDQTPTYSPQIALAQICHAWSEQQFADTIEHCIEYYVSYGYSRDDAHEHMLKQHALYLFPSFIKNIKKLSGYRPYIKNLHQQLLDKQGRGYRARKMLGCVNRGYIKLRAVTEQLYNEIIAQEKKEAAQQISEQKRKAQQQQDKVKALRIKHDNVRTTFDAQRGELMQESHEWHELLEICEEERLGDTTRIERRIQALNLITKDQITYTEQSYKLSISATKLLQQTGSDTTMYTTHYGNQLQQVIHQECIDGIEHCATLQPSAAMYPYGHGIALCFDAARECNQAGQTSKAAMIADFCWTLLDCGLAIAEGAVDGVVGAVKDIAEHPVQAVICAVAGQYVLAYQLSKVLYNVADIGITALEDTDRAAQKWDEYIGPITQIIDAIAHQQITVRDALKGATHLAVQWKIQGRILQGLSNICTTAKNRALEFAQKYPLTTPQDYMTTPEGDIYRVLSQHYVSQIDSQPQSGSFKLIDAKKGIYRRVAQSNEQCRVLYPHDEEKAWLWAEKEYEKIRSLSDDIEKIAQNTKKSKNFITRVKNHIFYDDQHILDLRTGRLDPDPEMAAAWDRLYHGDFIANDIRLLEHEYFESKIEKLYKTTLRQAHNATQLAKGKPWNEPIFEER